MRFEKLSLFQLHLVRCWMMFGCLLLYCVQFSKAEEGPWRWANPQPHGNPIRAMAKGEDFSIQVGDNGSVYTSQNLVQWL
ncbi:MAG: hypothetical protein QF731_08640, partial [Verrucomicrobiota bacterium]|nr:hypothetical protein [Verrucomicrobiota bacterium]